MRKAQVRIFETVAVLIVFIVLFGIGLVFYSRVQEGSTEEEITKSLELRALNIAEQAQNLPELQCSTTNIITERCFEKIKLERLGSESIKPKLDYFAAFGFSHIYVKQIYPPLPPTAQPWTIYDNKKTSFKSQLTIHVPVTIADTAQNTNNFGMLTVNVYD